MKLTATLARTLSLPAGKTDAVYWDDDVGGFGVRIRAGGHRSLVFQYKIGPRTRRMTLGNVAALDFSKARATARDLYSRVRLGQDPAGDKVKAKAEAAETFEKTAKLFLAFQRDPNGGNRRQSSYIDQERHILVQAKALHGLQLAKIERRDVARVVAEVSRGAGAVTGNRVRASLSRMFTWAMGEGLVDSNPTLGVNRNAEHARTRVLTAEELRLIWNHAGDGDYGDIVRLLTLTGQRAGEISGLTWGEIDFDQRVISLPGSRTKNHRDHVVPLSGPALAILAARPKREGRNLVFGRGQGPFDGWSNSKEALDARLREAGSEMEPWRIHDLRRTAATHMADQVKVQPHIIEAVLNHVSGHKAGVAGIYNHAVYAAEKRTALELWADWLLAVVEERASNVTPLRGAAS